ncbi:SsgA family sporulation/cell division regulator [Streptomyces acidicola]|uniref:SsgA family sporulation/cell division regulator n=1 Tax=Streptomyces acidicola TaxID=2596892 RepID=UPI003445804E
MDHLAAMDDAFDALLDASSLGAPHVVAETGTIPATSRRRMAQAVRRQQRTLDGLAGNEDASQREQADDLITTRPQLRDDGAQTAGKEPSAPTVHTGNENPRIRLITGTGSGKTVLFLYLAYAWHHSSASAGRYPSPTPRLRDALEARARLALWLKPACPQWDPSAALRSTPRHGTHQAAPLTYLGCLHTPFAQWLATDGTSVFGESRWGTSGTASHDPASALWSRANVVTAHKLLTLLRFGPWQRMQRLQDLRQFVRPAVEPKSAVMVSPVDAEYSVCTVEPVPLHVARFAASGYKPAASGLMLPAFAGMAQHHQGRPLLQRPEHNWLAAQLRAQRVSARARLWTTTTNGLRARHAELPMWIHQDEHEALTQSLHTRLTYRVCDPYAVEARFRADASDETAWTFARDLLRDGLERSTGVGDVTVWPDTTTSGQRRVFIRLTSPEGTALLSAADIDVRVFVEAAGELVEYGSEHTHLEPALRALETTIGELTRPGQRE